MSEYIIEIYDEGDYTLPDEPDNQIECDTMFEAVARFINEGVERYDSQDLRVREANDDGLPDDAIGLYEPGQPGNVVLQRCA